MAAIVPNILILTFVLRFLEEPCLIFELDPEDAAAERVSEVHKLMVSLSETFTLSDGVGHLDVCMELFCFVFLCKLVT